MFQFAYVINVKVAYSRPTHEKNIYILYHEKAFILTLYPFNHLWHRILIFTLQTKTLYTTKYSNACNAMMYHVNIMKCTVSHVISTFNLLSTYNISCLCVSHEY